MTDKTVADMDFENTYLFMELQTELSLNAALRINKAVQERKIKLLENEIAKLKRDVEQMTASRDYYLNLIKTELHRQINEDSKRV